MTTEEWERSKASNTSATMKRMNPRIFGGLPKPTNQLNFGNVPVVKESLITESKEELKNEKEFQHQVAALLRNRGIVFQQARMDRATGNTPGIPDFLFALRTYPGQQWGRPCAFECKMPGKNPTPEQSDCMSAMRFNGWDVRIVRSVDEVLAALNEWGAKEIT